jgi:molybdopterin-guanine dinucleotide biosynthesis protein A/molybdopterin converting factor small subunit
MGAGVEVHNGPSAKNAAAVILTGGKSSRMGSPKALLLFDGEPLVVHVARALNRLFPEVVVVAAPGQQFLELSSLLSSQANELNQPQKLNKPNEPNKPNELNVTIVRDEVAYQGPVGGIYYGVSAAHGEFCFVTSCDVPFLNASLISHLVSQISDCDVVVPYWQERFQPLCAVYRRSVAPLLKEQLERRELRPIFLYDKVRTRKVEEEEIRRFDPDGLSFFNMNSPEEYQTAVAIWKKSRQTPPLTCTVELFGVPRLLAKTKEVSLSLPQEATLSDVFSALAERLPVLAGRVINAESGALFNGYACNLNGLDFVRNPAARIKPGDKIFILAADAGG